MIVRIRFGQGRKRSEKDRKNQHVALAVASLLAPAVVMAFVLAGWRLAADLKVTGEFPIPDGIFSHWQVWLAGGAILELLAIALNRYGKAEPVLQKTVEQPERNLAESRF